MNVVNLQYGHLSIRVESVLPITIPLPLEQKSFPMWILPMQVGIRLYPLATYLQRKNTKNIPVVLGEFYSAMETLHINCIPPHRHDNSWWEDGNTICGYFPYETDNFILKITPSELQIAIYGNEINLNRVILDMLSCFSTIPPLHGAAVKKDEKTIILLGESGGGKTRILKSLMDKGYTYIADEEIFWNDNRIFCCGRVIVEKGWRPNLYPPKYAEANTAYSVTDVFLLTDDIKDETPPVLLPIIARQSFWAQTLVIPQNAPRMIERLSVANNQYLQILNFAKRIKVNQACIDESIRDIEKFL